MKLTSYIFSICLLLTTASRAQSFIAFSTGISSPTGAFSKSTAGTFNHWNNTAGFAKTGFTAGIDGAYYFSTHLGIGGGLYFSDHGGFNGKDAATLSASYTDAFAVDESTVSTSGRYRSLNILFGPYYSLPINKKLRVEFRVMAGLLKSFSTPSMTVLLEDQTAATFRQQSSTASAFGWQAGAGFRYVLTERLGLSLRADYFQSQGVAVQNENRPNNAGRLVTRQPMSWISSSIGVFFKL